MSVLAIGVCKAGALVRAGLGSWKAFRMASVHCTAVGADSRVAALNRVHCCKIKQPEETEVSHAEEGEEILLNILEEACWPPISLGLATGVTAHLSGHGPNMALPASHPLWPHLASLLLSKIHASMLQGSHEEEAINKSLAYCRSVLPSGRGRSSRSLYYHSHIHQWAFTKSLHEVAPGELPET